MSMTSLKALKAKVVLLPTEQKPNCIIFKSNLSNRLGIKKCIKTIEHEDCVDCTPNFQLPLNEVEPYHLYFTSDEPIKENDWYYNAKNNTVTQLTTHYGNINESILILKNNKDCHKVEVTTDTSLGLPTPSNEFIAVFINEYNKQSSILEVMIEQEINYNVKCTTNKNCAGYNVTNLDCNVCKDTEYKLKVDSHNTVSIHKIKSEWNREEVINLLYKAMNFAITERDIAKETLPILNIMDSTFKEEFGERFNKADIKIKKWIQDNL